MEAIIMLDDPRLFEAIQQVHQVRNVIHQHIAAAQSEGETEVILNLRYSDFLSIGVYEYKPFFDIYYTWDNQYYSLFDNTREDNRRKSIFEYISSIFNSNPVVVHIKIVFKDVDTYLNTWEKWSLD